MHVNGNGLWKARQDHKTGEQGVVLANLRQKKVHHLQGEGQGKEKISNRRLSYTEELETQDPKPLPRQRDRRFPGLYN